MQPKKKEKKKKKIRVQLNYTKNSIKLDWLNNQGTLVAEERI